MDPVAFQQAETLVYGMAGGISLACAVGFAAGPLRTSTAPGVAFCISITAYAAKCALGGGLDDGLPALLALPVSALAFAAIPLFWLLVQTMFQDRKPRLWMLTPILWQVTMGFAASDFGDSALLDRVRWVTFHLVQVALCVHAGLVIWRGWRDDLVPQRRRLRGPFLGGVAVYAMLMSALDLGDALHGTYSMPHTMLHALILLALCLGCSYAFLESRSVLFGAARPEPEPPAAEAARGDRTLLADLDRLQHLMTREEVWREEGLTIAGLAARAKMPETQLRRIINDRLGHRNFPSFVNAHRIAAAQARLSDPGEARTPVSAIAFDLGFGSLGPFNRAFREATGVSPTEWRRAALNGDASSASPIPGSA